MSSSESSIKIAEAALSPDCRVEEGKEVSGGVPIDGSQKAWQWII